MAKLQIPFRGQLPPIWETQGRRSIHFLNDPAPRTQRPGELRATVGVAGRSRDEMDGVPEDLGLAQGAEGERDGAVVASIGNRS